MGPCDGLGGGVSSEGGGGEGAEGGGGVGFRGNRWKGVGDDGMGDGGGAVRTQVKARGVDGVSWVGEVRLAFGEGGENQLEVARDGAGDGERAMGDGGGTAVGDGDGNAVGGEGGNAVWNDGGDVVGGDGTGVAGVEGGCEEEGGEGGDSTVGDEGNVRLGAKARRGAGVGDVVMTAGDKEVGGGNVDQIRSGNSAVVWGLSWGL